MGSLILAVLLIAYGVLVMFAGVKMEQVGLALFSALALFFAASFQLRQNEW